MPRWRAARHRHHRSAAGCRSPTHEKGLAGCGSRSACWCPRSCPGLTQHQRTCAPKIGRGSHKVHSSAHVAVLV
eukprot:scaffold83257_cov15-Tisochrysis_lutea.AAC.1